jgi:addiction module HigA family antidote
MIPELRVPTHPGGILLEEFLKPLRLSQVTLAKHLGVPVQRVNEIVSGKRGVTSEPAWLFAAALGTTPEFWVNAQSAFDLARSRPPRKVARLGAASRQPGRGRGRGGGEKPGHARFSARLSLCGPRPTVWNF